MISALHQQVRRTIRRHGLCPPDSRLLIGLSGGSDSVALTLLLLDLAEHGGFSVAALAHLNHRLRDTARRDEDFCRQFADQVGLPIFVEAIDVQAHAIAQRLSVEDAARRLRYDFLDRSADRSGANRIAVGHTRDDQAETFLLKLIRGAGPTGLGGVYPRRGRVIRPLLDTSRDDLRAHLRSAGQSWVEDETNADLENPRNRVRHRAIPELDRVYGASTSAAIARAASLSREDGQWLDDLSEERFGSLMREAATGLAVDAASLMAEPEPIRRRIVLKALRTLAGDREIGLEHVEATVEVLTGSCGAVDVPGSRVELRRGKLVLIRQGP